MSNLLGKTDSIFYFIHSCLNLMTLAIAYCGKHLPEKLAPLPLIRPSAMLSRSLGSLRTASMIELTLPGGLNTLATFNLGSALSKRPRQLSSSLSCALKFVSRPM